MARPWLRPAVVDASAVVDFLVGADRGPAVSTALEGFAVHAPTHLDAEVLSALGRQHRAGLLSADQVTSLVTALATSGVTRHPLALLLLGAWRRRSALRLADALYVELCHLLGATLVSTDDRLAAVVDVPVLNPV